MLNFLWCDVTFSSDETSMLSVDLNNINFDDVNFDEDNPEIIILLDLWFGVIDLKNVKHLKVFMRRINDCSMAYFKTTELAHTRRWEQRNKTILPWRKLVLVILLVSNISNGNKDTVLYRK